MPNPWLEIPLSDYEAHMSSPQVKQASTLGNLFAEALQVRRPSSVAILGVAGGNGLERIDNRITQRVVGIDIHPGYLEAIPPRFPHLPGLELHCVDLAAGPIPIEMAPVDLVHAALVFEHAGTGSCLDNGLSLVAENGAISIVLQLPSATAPEVGSSGVESLLRLASHFCFVDPAHLRARLADRGWQPAWESQRALPTGKSFWMGIFLRA